MKITTTKSVLASVCFLFLSTVAAMAATNTLEVFNLGFGTNSMSYNPTINLGDTVTWVWASGGVAHSTTAAPGQLESWDSGITNGAGGFTFSHTFSNLGSYNYYCRVHSESTGCRGVSPLFGQMTGTVMVVLGNLTTPYQINSITQQGNDILVSWITGGICMTNILQRSTGDAAGDFTTNFTDIFTLTNTVGNTTNFLDAGAATNFPSSYYRVRVPFP
jgi:plastocyanin